MRMRSHCLIVSLLLLCGLTGCARPATGNESAVIVLLDFSKSFAPYGNGDIAALDEVTKSIVQMIGTNSLKQPVKILWSAFGDNGLQPLEPCGPARVFKQRLTTQEDTAKADITEQVTTAQDLKSWFSVCLNSIKATSNSPQQFTDISGALMFASDAAEDVDSERVIVLFTDLLEDLPQGRQIPKLNLKKDKVLLIWRTGLDDQKQPAAISQRVEDWRKKFENAGAIRVCTKVADGLTQGEISSCLWNTK